MIRDYPELPKYAIEQAIEFSGHVFVAAKGVIPTKCDKHTSPCIF
jgi:hypothetical protein